MSKRNSPAIHVPMAGIVNYRQVCLAFVKLIKEHGGDLQLNTRVDAISERDDEVILETNQGIYKTKFLINCAGLYSDRIAKTGGVKTEMKIFPFRGEYYELKPEKRHLVKHLIYPVPDPEFPFLGVHFTRMIDGKVEAGPNAVLAFAREGYHKTDFNWKDFSEMITYPGLWKLGLNILKQGALEYYRSFSKAAFVRSLQNLIPEITDNDLVVAPAGIRAQALTPDGSLVDDFHIIPSKRSLHVCNVPPRRYCSHPDWKICGRTSARTAPFTTSCRVNKAQGIIFSPAYNACCNYTYPRLMETNLSLNNPQYRIYHPHGPCHFPLHHRKDLGCGGYASFIPTIPYSNASITR